MMRMLRVPAYLMPMRTGPRHRVPQHGECDYLALKILRQVAVKMSGKYRIAPELPRWNRNQPICNLLRTHVVPEARRQPKSYGSPGRLRDMMKVKDSPLHGQATVPM